MNRWVRLIFLRLLVLPTICALVVGVGLRYWFGVQDPQVTIPSPTMPSPNGFDLLKIAGEKVRADHNAISELSTRRSAYGSWEPKDKQSKPLSAAEQKGFLAERQVKVADLVRRHKDTLALARTALEMSCLLPPLRSWNDQCPYYADFRDLARLMVLEGEDAKANGAKPDDVARKYLDMLRLGEKISHGGSLIGHLVSIAVISIGQHALAPLATEVTPAMARKVIQTLKQCQQNRGTFAEAMTEEKYGMQAGVLELYQHPERFTTAEAETSFGEGQSQQIRMLPLAYLIWSKRTMFENITRQLDQVIAQAKQPYSADAPEIKLADDPISQIVFPVFAQGRCKEVLIQTQDELLIAQFATEAYRVEHGSYPANPEQQTKAGYPVPVDPFAGGKPLHCRRMILSGVIVQRYDWYSVGPDRKDDGGKPCENTVANVEGKQKFQVNPSSKGDIVPGVNVFK